MASIRIAAIIVEVKHRRGAMGSNPIRGFVGGRKKDNKALYVSPSGFTQGRAFRS